VATEFQRRRRDSMRALSIARWWAILGIAVGVLGALHVWGQFSVVLLIVCVCGCLATGVVAINRFRCPSCEQLALPRSFSRDDTAGFPTDPFVCPRCLIRLR
jgi:hypothetical protein